MAKIQKFSINDISDNQIEIFLDIENESLFIEADFNSEKTERYTSDEGLTHNEKENIISDNEVSSKHHDFISNWLHNIVNNLIY